MSPATERLAVFFAGLVAGEGCFTKTRAEPPTFDFEMGMGSVDAELCLAIGDLLGVGHLAFSPRRKAHYDDEVALHVRRLRDLVEVIVPFMDAHLPPSYKRTQYLEWRAALLDYWEHRAKRRRACVVEDCDGLRRAKGLCRRHYYLAYGA